jgi:hypothetical protein
MISLSERARLIAEEAADPLWHLGEAVREASVKAHTEQREICARLADYFSGPVWNEDERAMAKRIATAIRDQEQFAVAARMRGVEVAT